MDELDRLLVRRLINSNIREAAKQEPEPASLVPQALENRLAVLGRNGEHRSSGLMEAEPKRRREDFAPDLIVASIDRSPLRGIHGSKRCRQDVLRMPDEICQAFRLLGQRAHELNPRGPAADDGDVLILVLDLSRPFRAVDRLAPEAFQTGQVRYVGLVQQSDGGHKVAHRKPLLRIIRAHFDNPQPPLRIPAGIPEIGAELDMPIEVVSSCDVLEVCLELGLREVVVGPGRRLQMFAVPGVAVHVAFDVAPGAGVAVPVPGSADVGGVVDGVDGEPELFDKMEGVEAGEAGADDEGVVICFCWHGFE